MSKIGKGWQSKINPAFMINIFKVLCLYSFITFHALCNIQYNAQSKERMPGRNYFIGIPSRLVFTYRFDFYNHPEYLRGNNDKSLHQAADNIRKTIDIYNTSMGGEAEVIFLDHRNCRIVLEDTYPKLLPFFDIKIGKFQSDMCRIAEVYELGLIC
jgi:hypothetical protein